MKAEKRADAAIRYLKNTDALASHDYEPEIHAEFVRVWHDAIEAFIADLKKP